MDAARLPELLQGVARRDQLRRAGLTDGEVRSELDARRWRALGEVVVAAHNGPLTPQQRCWAAVLSCGARGRLAGLTTLEAAGVHGWSSADVHVVLPRATTRCHLPGVAVRTHETRLPIADGRRLAGYPPACTVERAAIDAASWSADDRSAAALLAAVVQQRLTTAPRLARQLDRSGRIRRRRVIRLTLGDIAGGAEALSEIDFARLCRRYRLGRLVQQVVRVDASGRKRYLDGVIEGPDGRRIAFEVGGSVHLAAGSYWRDMHRQNELFISGTPLLRFASYAARWEQDVVADQVRRALSSQ